MFRLLLVVLLSCCLFACSSETASPPERPSVNYKITKDEKRPNIKRSVEIVLPHKINEEELEKIAQFVEASDSDSYQRTFIGYFISGNDSSSGYWATTHFNPNLEVRILGLSMEKEAVLEQQAAASSPDDMLGTWKDDRPYVGARMELYQTDSALMLKSTYSDGSSNNVEMKSSEGKGGLRIEDKEGNDFGEYFVLNSAGDLEFWSSDGNYYTAKQIIK